MNPVEQVTIKWQCGSCGKTYGSLSVAEGCCDPVLRAEVKLAEEEARIRAFQKRVDEAIKVDAGDFSGAIYTDDGEFASSVEDFIDLCKCMEIPIPDAAWACISTPFHLPSAKTLIELECDDDHYEGIEHDVNHSRTPDLEKAIQYWNDAQTVFDLEPDFTRRVVNIHEYASFLEHGEQ